MKNWLLAGTSSGLAAILFVAPQIGRERGGGGGAPPATHPVGTPAAETQPASPQSRIDRLIEDLGSPEFAVRKAASDKLTRIGDRALVALERVADDLDPEVARRARDLIARIRHQAADDAGAILRFANAQLGSGKFVESARVVAPGVNELAAVRPDFRVVIRRSADGIHLEITRQVEGKTLNDTYDAADEDALRKKKPLAYQLYDHLVTSMGGDSTALMSWFEHPARVGAQ